MYRQRYLKIWECRANQEIRGMNLTFLMCTAVILSMHKHCISGHRISGFDDIT